MLSELFWISLGLTSEMDGYTKNPHIKFERGVEYVNRLGYDQKRQWYLHDLIYSSNEDKQKEFYNILGHDIDWSKYDKYNKKDRTWIAYEEAIQEVSINEGWKYFDDNELYADPVYRSLIGMEKRPAIISYKPYPEKVLLPPDELEKYNADMSKENKVYANNTFNSVALPIVFLVMSLLFASSSSYGGFAVAILSMIGAVVSSYVCWYMYKDKKANGIIQLPTYILCPMIAPIQIIRACNNCDISSDYVASIGTVVLIVEILHIICVIGYGIYSRNKYN